MSRNAFFASDHHFGHGNILTFEHDGKPIRPFSCVEEMNETIIERHNAIVKPNDRVYFLGDVAIARSAISMVNRLNGKKVLIKGNHDIYPLKDYLPHFDDIRSCKIYPAHGIICSHFPVHPGQLEYRFKYNVHGHLHQNVVRGEHWMYIDGTPQQPPDRRYLSVCLEQIDYTPISLEDIIKNFNY